MIVPPGTRSVDEIIKDLGKGILVTDFLGGNSNPTTGDFSVGIFGQYFEGGKIVHPVSEMNIADNHLKFWHKLAECANDPGFTATGERRVWSLATSSSPVFSTSLRNE